MRAKSRDQYQDEPSKTKTIELETETRIRDWEWWCQPLLAKFLWPGLQSRFEQMRSETRCLTWSEKKLQT